MYYFNAKLSIYYIDLDMILKLYEIRKNESFMYRNYYNLLDLKTVIMTIMVKVTLAKNIYARLKRYLII